MRENFQFQNRSSLLLAGSYPPSRPWLCWGLTKVPLWASRIAVIFLICSFDFGRNPLLCNLSDNRIVDTEINYPDLTCKMQMYRSKINLNTEFTRTQLGEEGQSALRRRNQLRSLAHLCPSFHCRSLWSVWGELGPAGHLRDATPVVHCSELNHWETQLDWSLCVNLAHRSP